MFFPVTHCYEAVPDRTALSRLVGKEPGELIYVDITDYTKEQKVRIGEAFHYDCEPGTRIVEDPEGDNSTVTFTCDPAGSLNIPTAESQWVHCAERTNCSAPPPLKQYMNSTFNSSHFYQNGDRLT